MEENLQAALLLRSLLQREEQLSASERSLVVDLTAIVEQRPPFWIPQTGPQTLAFESAADELFFGGAAGGGKSHLLLGLAATAHRKSLVLRREATQLKELTDNLLEICGGNGRWRSSGHGGFMRGLPGGRSIELAGCEQEKDKEKYKGRAHDAKLFDELSDFSESQYEFIGVWTRSTFPGQRCRRVGAGNPPTTSEGEWVIRRWAPWLDRNHVNPAAPTELRWYATVDGKSVEREDEKPFEWKGELIVPQSRTFIPATLDDNPILKETGYGNRLANLPEPLRSLYLKGDFTAGRKDDEWQIIPTQWVIDAQRRWREQTEVDSHGRVVKRPEKPLQCVGVDPARGGIDWTAIAKRYGHWIAPLLKYRGEDTNDGPKCAGKVLEALTEEGDLEAAIHIDVLGIGSSPYDCLRAVKVARLQVKAINASEATDGKDRAGIMTFRNVRAEMYWRLREALDPRLGDGLALPPGPEILADLTAPRWTPTASGILVESKDEIKKRIGRSPDAGDAIAMCCLPVLIIKGWKMETF